MGFLEDNIGDDAGMIGRYTARVISMHAATQSSGVNDKF